MLGFRAKLSAKELIFRKLCAHFSMAHHPMWRPDLTNSDPLDLAAPDEPEVVSPIAETSPGNNSRSMEADLAELAAKFAIHGGGLSEELSGELALDVILNEIVEQACLATGATGAAIAMVRDADLVCRASSGGTAPDLGARLDMNSGLSGTCARTQLTQCCDDALTDPRADAEASRELGVRSVAVVPLLREKELLGILEIFSPRARAFGDRDLRTLEVLGKRILKNVQARQSSQLPAEPTAPSPVSKAPQQIDAEEVSELPKLEVFESLAGAFANYEPAHHEPETGIELPAASARRFDWVTVGLGATLVLIAILMSAVSGMRLRSLQATGHANSAPPAPANSSGSAGPSSDQGASANPDAEPAHDGVTDQEKLRTAPSKVEATTGSTKKRTEPDSIQVLELSPDAAEGSLLHRVEPQYPEQALLRHIQGTVLLDVLMSRNGAIQKVQLISGDPLLAEAAIAAVRQWRFKPHFVNGRSVETETTVTLRFILPAG